MMKAKPLQVFQLGGKQIVVCQVRNENPLEFLDRDFAFYERGQFVGQIRIEGVSTAGDAGGRVFDFSYSGDEILPEQISEESIITDEEFDVELGKAAPASPRRAPR